MIYIRLGSQHTVKVVINQRLKYRTIVESYRAVDDVLVIFGKDYVVNGKYSIVGKQMIFVVPEVRTVLEEIEEQV